MRYRGEPDHPCLRVDRGAGAAAIRDREGLKGWQRPQVARFPKRAAESALNDNVLHGRQSLRQMVSLRELAESLSVGRHPQRSEGGPGRGRIGPVEGG